MTDNDTSTVVERNKATARRVIEEAFGVGRMEVLEEVGAPDVVLYSSTGPGPVHGVAGIQASARRLRTGFPDIGFTVDDMIGEGDIVVIRWSSVQTHDGDYLGMAPTHRTAHGSGMEMFRPADGRIQAIWLQVDALGVMQQLGVLPDPNKIPRPVMKILNGLQRLGEKRAS